MFPSVKDMIEVELKGFRFCFRRLTWRDTLGEERRTKLDLMASALESVSGKGVSFEEAYQIIRSLPIPIQDRVYIIYIGSQDDRRIVSVMPPWSAPEAMEFKENLDREEGEKDRLLSEVEEDFKSKYGIEALEEEKVLSNQIIQNSGYKGAILRDKTESGGLDEI